MLTDTIAAIATPLRKGGLAVIRISGRQAIQVAEDCFVPAGRLAVRPTQAASHTLHYGHVMRQGTVVDEVLLGLMRAPRTYTREDVVEFSCHGGPVAVRAVLETVLSLGARLAEPGEFTQRAFLNGRLDLAQAEAVADIVHARTDLALQAAQEQLAGKLSRRIVQLRDALMNALAHVEAHIDFPEEDIAPDTRDQLLGRLVDAVEVVTVLLRTAREGRVLRRGVRAVIVGRPNVGKSSLLNQLLGWERAIVSPRPGTTRDTIEASASIRGIPVIFVDTAGLREVDDSIEKEGVRRSLEAIEQSELVLHVVDGSEPWNREDTRQLEALGSRPCILVRNKTDLPPRLELPSEFRGRVVGVCALTGDGVDSLADAIQEVIWGGGIRADMLEVMINARHQDALLRAQDALGHAAEALRTDAPLEVVAMDLRSGAHAVGEIVGQTATEDLLDRIFSQFCIGK
jgi:tRNA modification GTPase